MGGGGTCVLPRYYVLGPSRTGGARGSHLFRHAWRGSVLADTHDTLSLAVLADTRHEYPPIPGPSFVNAMDEVLNIFSTFDFLGGFVFSTQFISYTSKRFSFWYYFCYQK